MTEPANNLERLIDALSQQSQQLETALLEILVDTRLANAEGTQLDTIGAIVGRDRSSATDDRYRDLLTAQIAINLASGTIQEILTIVELIVGADVDLELVEYFPAAFEIEADDQPLPVGQGANVAALVKSAKAGGVKGYFKWYETDPVFKLDGADGSQLDGGYYLCTSL
jgi:hypothetical protein